MSNNYPFIPSTLTQEIQKDVQNELPVFKELAFDFEKCELKKFGDNYYYVEKNEALKIWIWKALKIDRFGYLAYSYDYGHELNNLVGNIYRGEILKAELKRYIEEALLCNPYILSISDWQISQEGSTIKALFNVNTVYGSFYDDYIYYNE